MRTGMPATRVMPAGWDSEGKPQCQKRARTPTSTKAFTAMTSRLHAAGYADSIVLDRRTVVFNKDGAAIDSLWSRRRGDGSEIERVAVHFVVARRANGICVVTFETHATDAETLDGVWAVING